MCSSLPGVNRHVPYIMQIDYTATSVYIFAKRNAALISDRRSTVTISMCSDRAYVHVSLFEVLFIVQSGSSFVASLIIRKPLSETSHYENVKM